MYELKGKIVSYEIAKEGDSPSHKENEGETVIVTDVKLPDDAPARMKTLRAEGKKWYLTIVYHENTEKPFALFCHTNSKEKNAQTSDAVERLIALARKKGILEEHIEQLVDKVSVENNVGKLTRTISLLLRHNVQISAIINTIDEMEDLMIGSFLFQIKRFLGQYIREGEKADGVECSDCGGNNVVFQEGCYMCLDCSSTKCG